MRNLIFFTILITLITIGCSTRNPDAPSSNETHPPLYLLDHALEANADLTGCTVCHGADFKGTGNPVPNCFSCHESGPPFGIHSLPYNDPRDHGAAAKANQILCRGCHGHPPNSFNGGIVADPELYNSSAGTCTSCHPAAMAHPTNWQGTNEDIDASYSSSHRTVSDNAVSANCALCHNTIGPGPGPLPAAPSCFSASFTNADGITSGCHTGGFNQAPHDIPYTDAAAHGASAKADMSSCQTCHGIPGTVQFDGGIATTGCSATGCHENAGAHPARWQGTDDNTPSYVSSHRTAGSTNTACAICHNVTADTPGPQPGAPSCFSSDFTNSDGITTGCHAAGPVAPHAIPYADGAVHGPAAKADLAACQVCHGTPGTIQFNGGTASTGCSATGCHTAAGAHPTRWQGTNDNTPAFVSTHRNAGKQSATCSICHDFTEGRTAPDPVAPSCFSSGFTNADGSATGCHPGGAVAPHAVPFIDPAFHGPEAKADLTNCQPCHADPFDGGPGSNPRFNVGIGNLTNGCEDCHTVGTAHPAPIWSGATNNNHKTAGKLDTACALCHGATLNGGAGPACSRCHTAGDPLVDINCASCHGDPPGGDSRPNRDGSHSVHNVLAKVTGQCLACHNGFGTNSTQHYDENDPANVSLITTYMAKTGTLAYDPASNSCSGVSCHGGLATPHWETGTLNVNTDCLSCHERGTAQYNSFDSGKHKKHVEEKNIFCTQCHDTGKLATIHFSGMDTPQLEGNPADTLLNLLNYTSDTGLGCNVSGCHGTERW